MNCDHSFRASILSLPESPPRPLWSVMIPTYHCAEFLRQTLASVLAQDPGSEIMQIEVIDDCSTLDDPESVVKQVGQGRVRFYRQQHNVGHTKNFQTCLEHSRGHLIHLLHGDDCVRDGFYRNMQRLFEQNSEIGAAFCRHIHMDEQGHWQFISDLEQSESGILNNWLEKIAVEQRIQTPSMVVRRQVYETLGGFDQRLSWSEDWEMWVRIAAHYSVGYETQPLALYRVHSNSSSGYRSRTGENIRDLRRAIAIIKDYLPNNHAAKLSQNALEHYAFYALYFANKFAASGDYRAAINQIQEALQCSSSLRVIRPALQLAARTASRMLKSGLLQKQRSSNS